MRNYAIITKSDSNFFKGLVALVESIKVYKTQTPIIVIDCGLTKEELAYCKSHNCIMQNGSINIFKIPDIKNYYTPAIYGFLNCDFLNFSTLIHIDADAIVLGSLDILVNSAQEHGLAAVSDYPPLDLNFQIGNPEAENYIKNLIPNINLKSITFNAGVFAIKKDYYYSKMIPIVKKLIPIHEKLWGNDQAILNLSAYFANPKEPFKDVGYSFNTRPSYSRSPKTPPLNLIEKSKGPIVEGIGGEAKILHFVSRKKPWDEDFNKSCNGFKTWSYYYNLRNRN